jgi:cardiolipin synthase
MNIPNLLTLLRIILVPLIVIFLIQGSFLKALIVFIVAGISDALDGFLARVLHQQTVLGAYLDPIADKALLASSFITLSVLHIIPGWLTVIVISRDFIILLGISVLSIMSISVQIRPLFVSRVTTTLQLITVLMALSGRCVTQGFDALWLQAIYWLTALFTIISGLHYMARGVALINNVAKK